jgi:hypothetical protein
MTDQNLDRDADEEAGDAPVEAADTDASQEAQLDEHDKADSAGDADV